MVKNATKKKKKQGGKSSGGAPKAAKASSATPKIRSTASAAIKPKIGYDRPNRKKGEQPEQKYDNRPSNNAEREKLKTSMSLFGYSLLKPGRPRKEAVDETEKVPEEDATKSNSEEVASRVTQKSAPRGKYRKYNDGDQGKAMDAAVEAYILAGSNNPFEAAKAAAQEIIPNYLPIRSTVATRAANEKERRQQAASNDEHLYDRKQPGGRGLTSNDDVQLLQSIAVNRDNNNNGLSRKGAIQIISKITGAPVKKATEHFKYLVRAGKLKKLKGDGKAVKAQETTTNRTAVTTKKLFRTFMAQEEGKCEVLNVHFDYIFHHC